MSVKRYFDFGPVLSYFFRKKDRTRPDNISIRVMHGVNKASIIMFIVALLIMLYRVMFR